MVAMKNVNEITLEEKSKNYYYFQIDLLKAIIIIFVISEHALYKLPVEIRDAMVVHLWQRLSIPFFVVILGYNMGLSFKRSGKKSLKKLYSSHYFKKKIWRYGFPYLLFYVTSLIVGLFIYGSFESIISNQLYPLNDERHLLLGIAPFWGPGLWFIPFLFQTILIMPIIYKGFSGKTVWALMTLILCIAINFITSLLMFFIFGDIGSIEEWRNMTFLYMTIFMYIGGIGLGMWFSRNHKLFSWHNSFMWILFPLCAYYIYLFQFHDFEFEFMRSDYNIIFYTYVAFIFLILMLIPPKNPKNKFIKGITWIGKSSYHIFLVQIFYFGLVKAFTGEIACFVGASDLMFCILYDIISIIACVFIGSLWYLTEIKIRNYRLSRKQII